MNAYKELRHAMETAVADLQAGMRDTGFIVRYLQRALKTPRRNCDVGTAEEQDERFTEFCNWFNGCVGCPFKHQKGVSCSFLWSQMPYEEVKE